MEINLLSLALESRTMQLLTAPGLRLNHGSDSCVEPDGHAFGFSASGRGTRASAEFTPDSPNLG